MAVKIAGYGDVLAEVNAQRELAIAPTRTKENSGFVALVAESNPEGVGIGRRTRSLEVSADYRLRSATDSTLFNDCFSHAQINTSRYRVVNTTATNALSGGRWVLNSGNSVTSGQGTQFSTYAQFGLILSSSLYVDIVAQLAQVLQTNNVVEFGLFQCSGVAAPTDGVLFRFNASGVALGVVNIGGSETAVALEAESGVPWVPSPAMSYHFLADIHNDLCRFWIDDKLVGEIVTPGAFGSPFLTMAGPLTARIYNSGTVTTAQRLEVSNISVTAGDVQPNRLWPTVKSVMGLSSVNIPDGTAAGQTVNYANTAAPANATLSNTAAGYTTLGGQWQFVAVAGAETDYALFGYLNPASTAAIPGKNLIIRGVRIETVNTGAAVATTATLLQWGIGVGSTGVSLATAESATAGGRAPRRLTLGLQVFPISAAIGTVATPIDINLDAPVVVEPGTYFHVILKMPLGTATASQVVRGTCFINGYFE